MTYTTNVLNKSSSSPNLNKNNFKNNKEILMMKYTEGLEKIEENIEENTGIIESPFFHKYKSVEN